MDFITKLRDEFGQTHKEASDVITLASKESRELTAVEKEANDKRFSRLQVIKETIADHTKFAALSIADGTATRTGTPPGKEEFDASEGNKRFMAKDGKGLDFAAVREAVNHFARTGETRQLYTVSTSTGSGAYLPKGVLQATAIRRLQNSFRAVLDNAGMKPIELDTMSTISVPIGDDTANTGQAQSETATTGTELDPTDASLTLNPTLYSSKQFWYSNTVVLAGGFDIMSYTMPMAEKRIEKVQENAWTTTLKALTVSYTTAAAGGITYADLLNWEHSLAPAYRNDAAFLLSDSLYKALRGLTDDQHRPIMDQDPTNVFVGKIHGKPVIVNDYLSAIAANAKTGAFISAEAIKILDCMTTRIARYSLVPSRPDQIGFELFTNGDCKFIPQGVALLQQAAI